MEQPRIHVATVHWFSDEWAQLQVKRLREFLPEQMTLWAFLDGVSPELAPLFDHVYSSEEMTHHEKLDVLSGHILEEAAPDDLILFIDGDAFPIADLGPMLQKLQEVPLVAVKREENFGDQQPHPCFCLTTVGFWREIEGTWRPGARWLRSDGHMGTDVGGELYGILKERDQHWEALLRSNPQDLHPLFFAVYGEAVYHHGAGFRDKLCRRDAHCGIDAYSAYWARQLDRLQGSRRTRWARRLIRRHNGWYMRRKNIKLHKQVMARIRADEDFAANLGLVGPA